MLVAGFHEWAKRKAKAETEAALAEGRAPQIPCAECSGTGSFIDHGVRSGEEFDATCHVCQGTGTQDPSKQKPNTTGYSKIEYTIEAIEDLLALSAWTGKSSAEILSEAGFIVWSDLESRTLIACSNRYSPDYDWHTYAATPGVVNLVLVGGPK